MNPNQLRSHDVQVWDNPCDVTKPMSIRHPITKVTIPLEMIGTFCTFPSRVPTDDDLRNPPRIQLTSTKPWSPADATFYPHQLDEVAMMDIGQTSDAMNEYLSRIREASAIHSVNQQLLCSVSVVYSDGFVNAAMGKLDAEMVLKKGFRVGSTCRISSITKGEIG